MILGKQQLDENGIKKIQNIDIAENQGVDREFQNIMFFVSPTIKAVSQISDIIQKELQDPNNKRRNQRSEVEYVIVYWPQRTILCDTALEKLGIKGSVRILDFNFDLVPLDEDVLSYEMSNSFHELYVKEDLNSYKYIAESIQKIQTVFGKIPNIFAKGDGSRVVLEILQQEFDMAQEIDKQQVPEIESLLIFDRNIDLLTPQCKQMVYEAQIDEKFEIQGNITWIDSKVMQQGNQAGKSIGIKLTGEQSQVYKDIRNRHINAVNSKLQEKYQENKAINDEYQQLKDNKKGTLEDMVQIKDKIKRMVQMQPELEKHFSIIQNIMSDLNSLYCLKFNKEKDYQTSALLKCNEDLVKQIIDYCEMQCTLGAPIEEVLRLLIMVSQIENGIKPKEYDRVRRSLIGAYGFNKITTLDNLARCGLFKKSDGTKSNFDKVKDKFKLLNPEVDIETEDDVSYVLEGFTPIAARLTELAFKQNSWRDVKDYLNLIPGKQSYPEVYRKTNAVKPCALIFMIGGVTYSELAAFRYLGNKYGKEVIIATTQILDHRRIYRQIYSSQLDNTVIEKKEHIQDFNDMLEEKEQEKSSKKKKDKKKK